MLGARKGVHDAGGVAYAIRPHDPCRHGLERAQDVERKVALRLSGDLGPLALDQGFL